MLTGGDRGMTTQISNRWFVKALTGSNLTVSLQDGDLRYIAVTNPMNEKYANAEGKTDLEILGNTLVARELTETKRRVMETGKDETMEVALPGKDKGEIWFEVVIQCAALPDNTAGVIVTSTDITRQKIVLREMVHRTKNAFAMAMAVANQTARGLDVPIEFKKKFHARLEAMTMSQDAISKSHGEGALFSDLVNVQLSHMVDAAPGRVFIDDASDSCFLPPVLSQYIALALYELGTNATKYGALQNDTGTVSLKCHVHAESVVLEWVERGGPTPDTKAEAGFGRRLLETIIPRATHGAAEFNMTAEGLEWTLTAPRVCAER